MNQNTPNSGLTLRLPILDLHPLNGVVEAIPRMSTFDHEWYWTPRSGCRQGTEMREVTTSRGTMLNPEESVGQKLWEGLENQTDSRNKQEETWVNYLLHFPHFLNSPRLSIIPEESWPRRLSPFYFNYLHNNIWFDFFIAKNAKVQLISNYYLTWQNIYHNTKRK